MGPRKQILSPMAKGGEEYMMEMAGEGERNRQAMFAVS